MPKLKLNEQQRLEFLKDQLRNLKNTEIATKHELTESHAHIMQNQKWIQNALSYYRPILSSVTESVLDSLVTELDPKEEAVTINTEKEVNGQQIKIRLEIS